MAQVHLLIPNTPEMGHHFESVAIFAARRCRTTKEFDDLWKEVSGYTEEKRVNFLSKVVYEDWAADVLEMIPLVYDWEGVPMWLLVELFRHRLVWREFSGEQLSQRAIAPFKLQVEVANPRLQAMVDDYIQTAAQVAEQEKIPPEVLREIFPQGVLVNITLGANLRTFHHLWFMRSSPLFGGKGGAHPKFQDLADQMLKLAQHYLPITTKAIIQA